MPVVSVAHATLVCGQVYSLLTHRVSVFQGRSIFINTHGYLSSDLYPLLKFYAAMGLIYLGVGAVWLSMMGYFFRVRRSDGLWTVAML